MQRTACRSARRCGLFLSHTRTHSLALFLTHQHAHTHTQKISDREPTRDPSDCDPHPCCRSATAFRSPHPPTRRSSRISAPQKLAGHVTHFAQHEAQQLMAWGELILDERVVLHRVVYTAVEATNLFFFRVQGSGVRERTRSRPPAPTDEVEQGFFWRHSKFK